jgi:hypothetical protein
MPPDKPNRRLGQPAAPADDTSTTRVTDSITDQVNDGADPHAVGELLNTWIGLKMDEVDTLVDEARDKVDAIPSWRLMVDLVGELVIRTHALEHEVAQLKGARP